MICPRSYETGMPKEANWDSGRCSYCGSMNPDELIDLIIKGEVELSPTDKNYKVYVKQDGVEQRKFY